MQQPVLQVDLIPAEVDHLRNPKSMAIGDQYERGIPRPIPADTLGRSNEALDLIRGQVFPAPHG